MSLPSGLTIHGKIELEHERSIDLLARSYKSFDKVPDDFLEEVLYRVQMTL